MSGPSEEPFHGAKVALLIGARLLTLQRDDIAGIPWPGLWDLPGGGREGDETPEATAAREMHEEVGLDFHAAERLWARRFRNAGGTAWFFVARLPGRAERDIVLGDEGQGWRLTTPAAFVANPQAVPPLRQRVRIWLEETSQAAPDPLRQK